MSPIDANFTHTSESAQGIMQHYIDAWNAHDAEAIVALFAPEGSYCDPTTPRALRGQAIAAYANELWRAFPDLTFEVRAIMAALPSLPACEEQIAVQWIMRGTNEGPVMGLPPTGYTVSLPGIDLIIVEGDKLRSVRGYFDTRTFADQLGLQTVVQPKALGSFQFGTSTLVQSGKNSVPGVFSLTMIDINSAEEEQQVRERSRQMVREMCDMPDFISWVGVSTGKRMMTITAWESGEGVKQLMQSKTHEEGVKSFFTSNLANGAMTSVWRPDHIQLMMRCPSCGRVNRMGTSKSKCSCGKTLPEPMPYW